MDQEPESIEASYASTTSDFDDKLYKLRKNLVRRCQDDGRCGDNSYYATCLKTLNATAESTHQRHGQKKGRKQDGDNFNAAGNDSQHNDFSRRPPTSSPRFPGSQDQTKQPLGKPGESGSKKRRIDWDPVEDRPGVEDQLRQLAVPEKSLVERNEELLQTLMRPSVAERDRAMQFQSVANASGGPCIREYCRHLTKEKCRVYHHFPLACTRLHFLPLRREQTDESLGNCSYLDTCRNPRTCRYLHYRLDPDPDVPLHELAVMLELAAQVPRYLAAVPDKQWINCDVRNFDMTILGKFGVIMTDPPWEIHQDLPYGTMKDDEMRLLNIGCLQDDGVIFMWVTGRALELGRECLTAWGYRRVDELIWVKTNQLQQLIRTGRTGHWLNHTKEHCLVGVKGNPKLNRGVDCDVIVSEVRETSRKPDEVYRLLERLSPGTRKIEIFARKHNLWGGWLSLGNQLDDICIKEPDLRTRFIERYKVVPKEGEEMIIQG